MFKLSMSSTRVRLSALVLAALTSSISAIAELPTSQGAQLVWAHPQVRAELLELFAWLEQRVHHLGYELTEKINVPLRVHARYSRAEIQAAFGDVGADADEHARIQVPPWREGVKFPS